jgi:hypothetical protein
LAGSWGAYQLLARPRCGQQTRLSVAAAPEIAPAIRQAADAATGDDLRFDGGCVSVDVTPADPADVAAAIAGRHQLVLNGVGQASGKTRVPDVWIPDSSTWLQRLRTAGTDLVPDEAPSVASSPVVLGMPEPTAAALGWPTRKLTWAGLFPGLASDLNLRTGIVEPHRDAASLSGLISLAATGGGIGPGPGQQATIGVLRALATGRSTLREELLARFPRSTDAASVSSSLGTAPLSEQAVIAFNARQPPVPLAALYLEPAPVALDYPFTVLPEAAVDKSGAARALLGILAGDGYRNRLAKVGLRGDDATAGAGFAAPRGAPRVAAAAPPPDSSVIDTMLSSWTAVISQGRLLAVVDVSGSMLTAVPTAGGVTREEVTVEAARRGLALFDDTWAAGLWVFSTQLDGANDYRQLVPIGPLSDNRLDLLGQLASIRPKANGNTGLYDTTLAAYQAVQAGWDPSRVNSVVILTDGKNDDQQGLSLDQLIDALKATMDPARPIQVIAVGIGNDVSETELRRITDTAGGGTFIAQDPARIGEIFLKAIALRTTAKR